MIFPAIYLASGSPRRRELLSQMAVDFAVIVPDVDESVQPGESAQAYVRRIAINKALAALPMRDSNTSRPVLAADTAVVVQKTIFGKPVNDDDARRMLKMLSGQAHQVMTAVALASEEKLETAISLSEVRFASMSEAEIDWYIQTGEGRDKAGSYAIQGLAAIFIETIRGSYSGIMGLPVRETGQLLKHWKADEQ
ncbi:Maf family protein [Methylophaga sp. OBS1]|uniref:Maf family protein n=1 Tax=Methylophaga sp. OBS1 TaxID=2991933 RepID=UPI0022595186|nr:Maf family protein [Methylophaga sp. OBS1]MCX4193217.1 Maf family nucleotide pyrophosphatase [Methylophaga sp. OBS1]